MSQLPLKDDCVLNFISDCLSTASPTECGTCVNASSCVDTTKYLLDRECNQAPFSSSSAMCLSQVVTDCEHAFNTAKVSILVFLPPKFLLTYCFQACETCVFLHSKSLKSYNCTDTELAGVAALCAEIKPGV